MQNTGFLTLGQAARKTGKSKSVISKALNTGVVSYISKDTSGYKIDPAELFRVFPEKKQEDSSQNPEKERLSTPVNTNENIALKKEIQLLREQISDLKEDRNHWRDQAERTSLLLTDRREIQPEKPIEGPLNLWQWLGLAKR